MHRSVHVEYTLARVEELRDYRRVHTLTDTASGIADLYASS